MGPDERMGEWDDGQPIQSARDTRSVVVTDVRMPFGSMVGFMVKWALASIPAFLILALIAAVLGAVITAVFGGFLAALR